MTVPVRSSTGHRSLPTVNHTRPCRECPFRRVAAAGWLGGGTAESWHSDLVFGDTAFVCHMAEARGKRHFCAGSMIHFKNQFKCPRNPEFAAALDQFEKDTESVFQWPHEFKAHHESGPLAERRRTK